MFSVVASLLWLAAIVWILVYSVTSKPVNMEDWFDVFDEDDYP